MASGKYSTDFTGGTSDALDYYDGAALAQGDIGIVQKDNIFYPYILEAASGETENSPFIIAPDFNAGLKRWKLQRSFGVNSAFTIDCTGLATAQADATNYDTIFFDDIDTDITLQVLNIPEGRTIVIITNSTAAVITMSAPANIVWPEGAFPILNNDTGLSVVAITHVKNAAGTSVYIGGASVNHMVVA
jgi:hypothetical protein